MKIAVTAEGDNLASKVDPRFGRCKYFLICDSDGKVVEAIENSNAQASGGAGIQSAQLVVSKEVGVVLTGSVGPNAFKVLDSAGVKVMAGVSGDVLSAIKKLREGKLAALEAPNAPSKSGF